MDKWTRYEKLRLDTINYLTYLEGIGMDSLPAQSKRKTNTRIKRNAVDSKRQSLETGLESLARELGECKRCKLHEQRTHIVFGVGNPNADLVFIGEGPGRDEDLKGEPFVGRAGQLLTKIINAMELQRSDVYICNVVKCRPPGNRNPEPDEVATCLPFLERQIEIIKPRVVVALGTHAAHAILKTSTRITDLRGHFHHYRSGVKVMPTFHPAYLLRNGGKKKETWDDMKKVMEELGIEK